MSSLIEKIKDNSVLRDIFDTSYDINFDEGAAQQNFEWLTEFGKCEEYELLPFASDGAGGAYVFLNKTHVGFISSEGEAGVIAKNIKDFLTIILCCRGSWYDYCQCGVFDNYKSFVKRHEELSNEIHENSEISAFAEENELIISLEELYAVFKAGVSASPNFVILPTDEDYGVSDDFFGTEQEYLEKLRG